MAPPEITVRPATDDDLPAVLAVATAALGWAAGEPHEEFFRWKHHENPAGRSPMWVAAAADTIVGFRTMMHWRFVDAEGSTQSAVRAVDTATHPGHHRKGIFTRLTLTAVEVLAAEGVGFVFNTPNPASRAGYMAMGWNVAGRVPLRWAPATITGLTRTARARTSAAKWSEPAVSGDPIDSLAEDLSDLASATRRSNTGLATDRSAAYYRWRYGFEPLQYRVLYTHDAAAIVRRRRRGPAIEAVVAELHAPDRRAAAALVRHIRKSAGADHVLATGTGAHASPRLAPLPRAGPILTVRDLGGQAPKLSSLRLSLGDVELF